MKRRLAMFAALVVGSLVAAPLTAAPALAAEAEPSSRFAGARATAVAEAAEVRVQLTLPDGYEPAPGIDAPELEGVRGVLSDTSESFDAFADADGVLTFTGVEAGWYTLGVDSWNGTDLVGGSYRDGVLSSEIGQRFYVPASGLDLDAELRQGAVLRGQVLDAAGAPVDGAQLNSDLGPRTDVDGRFVLTLDPSWADPTVYVVAPDGSDLVDGYWVADDQPVTAQYGDATRLPIGADLTITPSNITVRLAQGATVTGIVRDAAGNPARDVEVSVGTALATTGGDGRYTVTGVSPGQVNVHVTPSTPFQAGGYLDDAGNAVASWQTARAITVIGSETIAGLDVRLATGGVVHGTLAGVPDGVTVGVGAYQQTPGLPGSGGGGAEVKDGTFDLNLAPGTWTVSLYPYGPGSSAIRFDPLTVTVVAGEITNVAATATPTGSVSGRIVDAAGTPLGDVQVSLSLATGSGAGGYAQTNPDGTFRARGMAPGTYTLNAVSAAGSVRLEGIVVTGGAETRVGDLAYAGGASIEVIVTDAGGTPLRDASVNLNHWDGQTSTYRQGLTDANGRVTLGGLEPGYWGWNVSKYPGYVTASGAFEIGDQQPEPITVALQSATQLTLDVRVDGEPLRNEPIALIRPDGSQATSGFTDSNGRATISLVSGEYAVALTTDVGFGGWQSWTGNARSAAFTVAGATASHTVDLDGGYAIDVVATLRDGSPATDTYLSLSLGDGDFAPGVAVATDAVGHVRFDNLRSGSYRLSGYLDGEYVYYDGATGFEGATPIVLSPTTKVAAISFAAREETAHATMIGTVTDEDGSPLPGERVRLTTNDFSGEIVDELWAETNENGEYSFDVVPTMSWRVDVAFEDSDFVSAHVDGTFDGATEHRADVTLRRGVSFSGTVRGGTAGDPLGETESVPLAGASVSTLGSDNPRSTYTDDEGNYTLRGIDPAQYPALRVSSSGDHFPVSLDPAAGEFDATLELGGRVSGVVAVEGIDEGWAFASFSSEEHPNASLQLTLGETYTSPLLHAGTYLARFQGSGGFPTYYENAATPEDATPIEVRAGEIVPDISVVLERASGVEGTITAGGVPLAGADVSFWAGDEEISSAQTGSSGHFRLEGRRPGDVTVRVSFGGSVLVEEQLTLTSGTISTLDLEAPTDLIRSVVRVQIGEGDAGNAYGSVAVFDGDREVARQWAPSGDLISFVNLEPGALRFVYEPSDTYLSGAITLDGTLVDDDANAPTIDVADGQTYLTLSAPAERAASLSGLVRDDTGLPLSGASVSANGLSTDTAGDGAYAFPTLRPGTYEVRVEASGHAPQTFIVTLAGGDAATQDAALQRYGTVEVTVTDVDGAPLGGVPVELRFGPESLSAESDGDGIARFGEVPTGAYDVYVAANTPGAIAAYLGGGSEPSDASRIVVAGGVTASVGHTQLARSDVFVDIAIPDRVGDSARVDLLDPATGEVLRTTRTLPVVDGSRYVVSQVVPGSYLVRVSGLSYATVYLTEDGQTTDAAQAATFVVRGDGVAVDRPVTLHPDWVYTTTEITSAPTAVRYATAAELVAEVTASDPDRVSSLRVELQIDGDTVSSQTLDGDGGVVRFDLPENLQPGAHEVRVVTRADRTLLLRGSVAAQALEITRSLPTLELDLPDAVAPGEQVALGVTATHANGTPVASGTLVVEVGGMRQTFSLSNGSAELSLGALDAGVHEVTVTLADSPLTDAVTETAAVVVRVPVTVTGNVAPITAGTPGVLQVKVAPSVAVNGPSIGGTVTVSAPGWDQALTAPVVNGTASVPLPALPVGQTALTLSYEGDGLYAPALGSATATVRAAASTTTLEVSEANPVWRDDVTATVTVTTEVGRPSGTIAIHRVGANGALGDQLALRAIGPGTGNTATVTVPTTTAGRIDLVAVFTPADDTAAGSRSEVVTVTVAPRVPAASLALADPDIVSGDTVTGVIDVSVLGAAPRGTVSAELDGTTVSPLSIGEGRWRLEVPTAGLAAGTYEVRVAFTSTDPNVASTTATATLRVSKAASSLTASLDRSTVTVDDDPVVVAIDQPGFAGGSVTVLLRSGTSTEVLGTQVLGSDGRGSFTLGELDAGSYTVIVVSPASASAEEGTVSLPLTVSKIAGVVSAEPGTARFALDPVVVKARFVGAGAVAPTGAVVLTRDGAEVARGTLAGGAADLAVRGLGGGTYTLRLAYAGDDRYPASSADVTVTVTTAPVALDVTWPTTQTFGAVSGVVTVGASVSGASAVVSGGVELLVDGVVAVRGTLSNGAATLALPTGLRAGAHALAVRYLGNADTAAASASGSVTVEPAAIGITVDGPAEAVFGQQASWAITLKTANGVPATASILVSGSGVSQTIVPDRGVATFVLDTDTLPAGEHRFEITYPGEDGLRAATARLDVTVVAAASTTTAAVRATTVPDGLVELAVQVTAASGPIGGTVSATAPGAPRLSGTVGADGRAVLVVPSDLADGEYAYTVVYDGGRGHVSSRAVAEFSVSRDADLPGGVDVTPSDSTVATGDQLEVVIDGLTPGDSIQVFLHSFPVYLGTAVADGSGRAVLRFTVPADLPPGEHRIEVRTPTGVVSQWVTVTGTGVVLPGSGSSGGSGASVSAGALPATGGGGGLGLLAFLGGLLALLGAAGLITRRRSNA